MENNNLSDQYFNETKNLKEELERYKISYKIKKFYDENTCLGMRQTKQDEIFQKSHIYRIPVIFGPIFRQKI